MRIPKMPWLAAFLMMVAALRCVQADSVVYGPIYDPNDPGYSIEVISKDNWAGAEAYAQTLGGHLATVVSAADNSWIVSNLLTDHTASGGPNLSDVPVWLGLYDPHPGDGTGSTHAADFQWADGRTAAYRNWNDGEPNNFDGTEYYTAIGWHHAGGYSSDPSTWNDTPVAGTFQKGGNSDGPYYGLVELAGTLPPSVTPLPSSLLGGALLFCGIAIGAVVRRRTVKSSVSGF